MEGTGEKIKGSWSPEEDDMLIKLVDQHGPRNWSLIRSGIPGRSGKSCRLRWCNQLSPAVHHCPFTPSEDAIILQAHAVHESNSKRQCSRTSQEQSSYGPDRLDDDQLGLDGPETSLTLSLPGGGMLESLAPVVEE
ncbi:hypothetical protein RND71_030631 [Anisodus tanguticus]|uniref:Uncharacterized protein n=1 Tax=Anisodus tanguticus TaxID=243964 RepID=A0AAE1RHY5_9SOLA|nr:hypothetical protein RND71_030631 [Anisodus tanguticus]